MFRRPDSHRSAPRPTARVARLAVVAAGLALGLLSAAGSPTVARAAEAKAAAPAATDSLPRLEAAAQDTNDYKANYRLGVAYLDRDRPLEAAAAFRRATRVKPDYLEAWVNLGAAEDANGHGHLARLAYFKAVELSKNDEIALCRLASSLYATGARDSAMDVMRGTLKVHPRSYCTYFTLGVAFADAGMYRDAVRSWEKVVELAPNSAEAESAKESTKLLREVLGPEGMAPVASPPGVPPGAGGPTKPLEGGGMKGADGTSKGAQTKPAKDAKGTPAPGTKPATGHEGHNHPH